MSKTFSANDVSSHSKADDLWIIVDEDVYDLTKFQDDHPGEFSCTKSRRDQLQLSHNVPYRGRAEKRMHSDTLSSGAGGKKILQRVAGKDASKQFWKYHNEGILKKYKGQLQVGSLDTKKVEAVPAAEPMPVSVPKKATPIKKPAAGEDQDALEPFGEQIPYSDPSWYQSVSSPILLIYLIRLRNGRNGPRLTRDAVAPFPLLQRIPRRPPRRDP